MTSGAGSRWVRAGRAALVGALAFLVAMVASCSPPEPGPETTAIGGLSTSTSIPAGDGVIDMAAAFNPDIPPNPVMVEVVPEEAAALGETVLAEEAATLTATGADGTRYTLEIPAGALLWEADIRLIPVAEIAGLPLSGGLIGAVQLEPEGLLFLEPATLSIETTSPVDPAELAAFGLAGEGSAELYGFPAEVEGSLIRISLTHFSGYGAGRTTYGERWAREQRKPSEYGREMQQYLADLGHFFAEKYGDRTDFTDEELAELERLDQQATDLMRKWFEVDVRPALREFETSKESLVKALWRWLDWYELVNTGVGQEDQLGDLIAEGEASFARGVYHAIDQSFGSCVQDRDPYQGLDLIFLLELIFRGLVHSDDADQREADAQDKLDRCWRFELRYRSTVEWAAEPWRVISEAEGTLPLKSRAAGVNPHTATGELNYQRYEFILPADWVGVCTVTTQKSNIPVTVEVNISLRFRRIEGLRYQFPRVSLTMTPSRPAVESVENSCASWTLIPLTGGWYDGFWTVHTDAGRNVGLSDSFGFSDGWTYPADQGVLARWGPVTESSPGMGVQDTYTLEVIHTPQR